MGQIKHKRLSSIPPLVLGLIGIAFLGICIALFGEAFRAHVMLFLVIWVLAPVIAFIMQTDSVVDSCSETEFEITRAIILIFVIMTSVMVLFAFDRVRNCIGERYVQGYHHWSGGTHYDDNDQVVYNGDNWSAKTSAGRWGLNILHIASVIGVFLIPYLCHRLIQIAFEKQEELSAALEEYIEKE